MKMVEQGKSEAEIQAEIAHRIQEVIVSLYVFALFYLLKKVQDIKYYPLYHFEAGCKSLNDNCILLFEITLLDN